MSKGPKVEGLMEIITIQTPALGDRSYVLVSGDEAAVIDPQRDIDRVEAVLADTAEQVAEAQRQIVRIGMDRAGWNQRYETTELVWSAEPNQVLALPGER